MKVVLCTLVLCLVSIEISIEVIALVFCGQKKKLVLLCLPLHTYLLLVLLDRPRQHFWFLCYQFRIKKVAKA